ncbi:MAG: PQQ-binding-like beta-propeller repeat protein [Idiomarina sp.]|nr:PQQ-binding-like beta-propeller repeat protein [Idiomarina sp.]
MANLRPTLYFALCCLVLSACGKVSELEERVERSPSRTQAAAISNDATLSFVATSEHGLMLFDLANQQRLHNWQQDEDGIAQITSVAIAADNSVAVAASRETIAVWNIETGEVRGYWRMDESTIRDVAVSNRGQHIVIGRADGVIVLYEPATGRRLEFFGHSERINSVDISPNGRFVLSGGDDHKALVWQAESAQVVHEFAADGRVARVRFNPDGSSAFVASAQTASIWHLTTGELISELRHRSRHKSFLSASFSTDGDYLVTGSPSRHLEIWRVNDGKRMHSVQVDGREREHPPRAAVIAVAFASPQGTVLSENSAGFAERWHFDLAND